MLEGLSNTELLTAAGALSALVSALVSLWIRWADRTEASWIALEVGFDAPDGPVQIYDVATRASADGGRAHFLRFDLANVGDAGAHLVRLRPVGCEVYQSATGAPWMRYQGYPIIKPGEGREIRLRADLGAYPEAMVVVSWIASPTRRRRRARRAQVIRVDQLLRDLEVSLPGVSVVLGGDEGWSVRAGRAVRAKFAVRRWRRRAWRL